MEKKISSFYRKLDEIKKRSVTKLPLDKQKEIYTNLKKEKEEKERLEKEKVKALASGQ